MTRTANDLPLDARPVDASRGSISVQPALRDMNHTIISGRSSADVVNDATVPRQGDTEVAERVTSSSMIEVVEEKLIVEKRMVDTARVIVRIEPHTEEQAVEVPLVQEEVHVERVPINKVVAATSPTRQEGDVTIIPVYEEVIVVEKRLVLKEELRLTRRRATTIEKQTFTVRKEEVIISRENC